MCHQVKLLEPIQVQMEAFTRPEYCLVLPSLSDYNDAPLESNYDWHNRRHGFPHAITWGGGGALIEVT